MNSTTRRLALILALLVLPLARAATAAAPPNRIVYVLAGQSNIDLLAISAAGSCASPGPTQANVTYWLTSPTTPTPSWPRGQMNLSQVPTPFVVSFCPPVLTLGNLLGQHHAGSNVEILHMAISGSALLWRNQQPGGEAWIDSVTPSNPSSLVRRYESAMQQLALGPQDELHIIWGQGETDCYPQGNTQLQEYADWAQLSFAWMAMAASKTSYSVHLVTLGALNDPVLVDADVDRIRDAYTSMVASPLTIPLLTPKLDIVAHHYDLKHADALHLTTCAYVDLARRIATGITAADSMPMVLPGAPTRLPGGFEATVQSNMPLVTRPPSTVLNNLFTVTVNGIALMNNQFTVGVAGQTITVHVNAGTLTSATPLSIRYVPGSGNGRSWDASAPIADASMGMPLSGFIAQ